MLSERSEKSKILQRIAEGEGLPSPSPVVLQLLQLAADEHSSVADLASIIEQDPGLTTRLLKLANSAFFSGPRKAASVAQAILLVGHTRLRVTALSLSLRDSFPFGRLHGLDYDQFWKTSLYRALIGQGLLQQMGHFKAAQPEEVFTAGLLQEIGLLMLHQVCPDALWDSFPSAADPLEETLSWEERHFAVNHRQVGFFVLKRWGFPEAITESQKYYGPSALSRDLPVLARVLEFSRLASQVFFDERQQFDVLRETAPILDLKYDQIADTLCSTFARVAEVSQAFLLKVDASQDMVEVIEKANRTLVKMNDSLQANLGKALGLLSTQASHGERLLMRTLHEQQKTVGNVLDAVAHEIRNPLMAIGGFAQRLAREVQGCSQSSRYVTIIIQEAERLQQILETVSSFSRSFTPAWDVADLTATVDESINELEVLQEFPSVVFSRQYPKAARFFARFDSVGLKTALLLALRAVAEFAVSTDCEAEVLVRIRESAHRDYIMVDIAAGGGISREVSLETLLDADFSSKTLGKGIDFLQAWKIVESHGGTITFEKGQDGSHLVISLPF